MGSSKKLLSVKTVRFCDMVFFVAPFGATQKIA